MMTLLRSISSVVLALSICTFTASARADDAPALDTGILFPTKDKTDAASVGDVTEGVTATLVADGKDAGLKLDIPVSTSYPGIALKMPAGGLNLSGYKGIDAEIANVGKSQLSIGLRVDNEGDWQKKPWSSENLVIAAGQTLTVHVTFGVSFGQPAYALDPAHISGVLVMAVSPSESGSFVIKSIKATK